MLHPPALPAWCIAAVPHLPLLPMTHLPFTKQAKQQTAASVRRKSIFVVPQQQTASFFSRMCLVPQETSNPYTAHDRVHSMDMHLPCPAHDRIYEKQAASIPAGIHLLRRFPLASICCVDSRWHPSAASIPAGIHLLRSAVHQQDGCCWIGGGGGSWQPQQKRRLRSLRPATCPPK